MDGAPWLLNASKRMERNGTIYQKTAAVSMKCKSWSEHIIRKLSNAMPDVRADRMARDMEKKLKSQASLNAGAGAAAAAAAAAGGGDAGGDAVDFESEASFNQSIPGGVRCKSRACLTHGLKGVRFQIVKASN